MARYFYGKFILLLICLQSFVNGNVINMRLIHTTERPLNTVNDLYKEGSLKDVLEDLQLKQSPLTSTEDLRQRMELYSQISFSFSAPIVRNLVAR